MADSLEELRRRAVERILKASEERDKEHPGCEEETEIENLHLYQAELESQNEELRESQQRLEMMKSDYQEMFDYAPLPYIILLDNGRILQANFAAAELLGMYRGDIQDTTLLRFCHADWRDKLFLYLKKLGEKRRDKTMEIQMVRADGTPVFVRMQGVTRASKEGEPQPLRLLLQDISEYKEASQHKKLAEAELQAMLRRMPDVFYRITEDGTIRYINEAVERYGYGAATLTGESFFDLVHPEDREKLRARLAKPDNDSAFTLTVRFLQRDGSSVYMELRHSPRNTADILLPTNQSGTPSLQNEEGWEGIARDVSRRREAEESLEAEKNKYQTMMEALDDCVFICDEDFRVLYANSAMQKFVGRDVTGETCYSALHGLDTLCSWCPARQENELEAGPAHWEWKDDKSGRFFQIMTTPLGQKGGKIHRMSILRDVTESRQAMGELQESQQRYKALFENSRDALLLVQGTRCANANSAAARFLGLPDRKSLVGKDLIDLLVFQPEKKTDLEKRWEENAEKARQEGSSRFEVLLRRDSQPLVVVDILFSPMTIHGEEALQVTLRDITDQTREFQYTLSLLRTAEKLTSAHSEEEALSTVFQSVSGLDEVAHGIWLDENMSPVQLENIIKPELEEHIKQRLFPIPLGTELGEKIQEGQPVFVKMGDSLFDYACLPDGCPCRQLGFLPVMCQGRMAALFVFCSQQETPFPLYLRNYLQAMVQNLENTLERQRMAGELKETQERFHLFMDQLPACAFIRDEEGRLVYINQFMRRHFDFDKDLGAKVPEDFPAESGLTGVQVAAQELKEDEYFLRDRQNHLRCVQVYRFSLERLGNPEWQGGVAVDVTEQHQVKEELQRLAIAIEHAAESIVITDVEGDIEYVNPAFEEITGYSREEIIGQNPRVLKSGKQNDAFYQELWETIKSGQVWNGRFLNRTKSGGFYEEDATISPIFSKSGYLIGFVAVKRDITEEVHLEAQLRQSQKMEAIGQLAGGVAHDFNNLLQVIVGHTEMSLLDLDEEHPLLLHLNQIQEASRRATTLVRQLLTFSRQEEIRPEKINLNDNINDLLKMLRRLIGEKVELVTQFASDLKDTNADPGQVEQVIMNLCVNARDAMPEGGQIFIETTNVVLDDNFCTAYEGVKKGEYVLLTVSDTGSGIPAEIREHIFEPFFTTKAVGQGTGLGLSMVYGIIQQHEGVIHVYSENNQGTVFKIYLPVAKEERSNETLPSISAKLVGGSETILLAEDDELVRNLAWKILRKGGYQVLVARDGVEAEEILKEQGDEVNLALLDVIMPVKGGKAVYDFIRANYPHIIVLFSSGYSMNLLSQTDVPDCRFELIHKPYHPTELLQRLRKALDGETENEEGKI